MECLYFSVVFRFSRASLSTVPGLIKSWLSWHFSWTFPVTGNMCFCPILNFWVHPLLIIFYFCLCVPRRRETLTSPKTSMLLGRERCHRDLLSHLDNWPYHHLDITWYSPWHWAFCLTLKLTVSSPLYHDIGIVMPWHSIVITLTFLSYHLDIP